MTGLGPQNYLRRCNNQPHEGMPTDRASVERALAEARTVPGVTAVAITGDLETGLRIRIPPGHPWAVEAPGTVEREFTYLPVPAATTHREVAEHRAPTDHPVPNPGQDSTTLRKAQP